MTLRLARRRALLLVASALAAGPLAVASPAHAASEFECSSGEACVHITYPDGGYPAVDVPATVMADHEDLTGVAYPVKNGAGDAQPETITGLSLPALLQSVVPPADQLNPSSVESVVVRNSTSESALHAGDLDVDPTPFDGGQLSPAFGLNGTAKSGYQIEYIRPQRDPDDSNSSDRFIGGSGDLGVDLEVRTAGAVVHPVVTPGKGPWKVKDHVTFSATFPDSDPPHANATFSWIYAIGDPPEPGAASASHRYPAPNTYRVSVAVSGDDPGIGPFSGQSPPVTVTVGTPPRHKPHTGPTGGTGDGPTNDPQQGPTKGPGQHEGSSPKGGPTAAAPTSTPSDAPTATAASPGSTGGAPTSGGAPSTTPTSARHTSSRTTAGAGAFVQGVIIDGRPVPVDTEPSSAATRAAATARRPAPPLTSSFDARWLWFLLPVLLLAGGALGERRRTPHRHGPRSRS